MGELGGRGGQWFTKGPCGGRRYFGRTERLVERAIVVRLGSS